MYKPITIEEGKYSLGTTPIYNTLLQMINARELLVDTLFVNVSTILRNCNSNESVSKELSKEKQLGKETDKPADILISESKKEILNFIQDIIGMFNDNKRIFNPTVVAYFGDYSKCIPQQQYRTPPPSKRAIVQAESMLKHVLKNTRSVSTRGTVRFIELPITNNIFPHKHLINELGSISNNHIVAHITNHPCDYHVNKYCSDYKIIQSYTGKVLRVSDLSEKIFGTADIPFNPITHGVFGDKEDIKCSLTPAEKKKAIEIAKKESWSIHTAEWIYDRFRELGIRVPVNL